MEHGVKWKDGETGGAIGDAPLSLSSTGLFTPKSTLSYEDGKTWFLFTFKLQMENQLL